MPDHAVPTLVFRDGAIDATIDTRVYRLTAIQKAAYRFADRFTAVLGSLEEHQLPVRFVFRSGTDERAAVDAARLFFQELLDQELRELVGEETRAIRSLILAHAFSNTDLIRRDR